MKKFLTAILIVSLLSTFTLSAYDVAVVSSGNLSTFNQVIASFIASVHTSYKVFNLKDGEDKVYVLLKMDSPRVFFVVGGKALHFVLDKFPHIPAVYSLILHEEEIPPDAGNITGIRNSVPFSTQVKYISSALSSVKSIGVLYSPKTKDDFRSLKKYAGRYGIKVDGIEVNSTSMLTSSFFSLLSTDQAFWLLFDPLFLNPAFIKMVILKCVAQGKPLIAFSPVIVKAGALIAVAPDYGRVGRLAAVMVRKILAGVRADHIPRADPPVAIYINGIIAEKTGINFPSSVLKIAIVFK